MPNYAYRDSMPTVPDDKVFNNYNFARLLPNTKIFEGVSGLTFIDCNLLNCDIPEDAVKTGCLHFHKSMCTNLHPHLIDLGVTACVVECSHMVSKEEITIDGILVDTLYEYEDTIT